MKVYVLYQVQYYDNDGIEIEILGVYDNEKDLNENLTKAENNAFKSVVLCEETEMNKNL